MAHFEARVKRKDAAGEEVDGEVCFTLCVYLRKEGQIVYNSQDQLDSEKKSEKYLFSVHEGVTYI